MNKTVNFRRIVQEIEDAYGWDDSQLAKQVKVNQSTINRLKTGSTLMPTYAVGDRLVRLHDERPPMKVKK